jgi:large subunit ribosomal protein L21
VEHAGKQFVAAEGQRIEIDRLAIQAGAAVEFGEVLLLRDTDRVEVGAPYVSGARVKGTVEAHIRGPKILVFKYRAKQRYRVRQGHRQALTRVTIESIGLPGGAAAEPKAQAAEPQAEPAAPRTEPAAPRRPARKPAEKTPAAPKPKAARKSATRSRPADRGKSGSGSKKPAAKKPAASKKK